MIDHLIKAADEADFLAMMNGHLGFAADNLRDDISHSCQVFMRPTVTEQVDETGEFVVNRNPMPYYYRWIALPGEDGFLAALPSCIIIADRAAAERGDPFVLYATLPAVDLDVYMIEPVVMGSRYPFGRAE